LQYAKELGLKLQRNFPYFIKKNGAPMRELKAANALRNRAILFFVARLAQLQ
jgi:hypothetical protein